MPKVSVVVPVYGVEKYIERCARSLLEQTLQDMQFIFVDDCSQDNSIKVLQNVIKDYPHRIHQILIIHHEKNQGLPFARKTGIEVATGDYIIHCDSDDWVDEHLYETLYNTAINHNADVAVCNCIDTDGNNNLSERVGGHLYDIHDCIDDMLYGRMWWSLCNKLIRREIYNHSIDYPKDGMGEDMCMTLQLFLHCKSIVYCPDVHYYYYINQGSMIRCLTEEKCISNFNQIRRNIDLVINNYKQNNLYDLFRKGFFCIKFKAKSHLHPLLGNKEHYKFWRESYKGVEYNVVLNNKISIKDRVVALLTIMGLFPYPRDKYSYFIKNKNENF